MRVQNFLNLFMRESIQMPKYIPLSNFSTHRKLEKEMKAGQTRFGEILFKQGENSSKVEEYLNRQSKSQRQDFSRTNRLANPSSKIFQNNQKSSEKLEEDQSSFGL